METLSHTAQRVLHDVVTLGSFSPQTFHIGLSADFVSTRAHLPAQAERTLGHEFGHLLHYLTSYLGLRDLSFWVESIDVLLNPPAAKTPEEQVTWQSEQIMRIARSKQVLSIDDEYYFEERAWEIPNALANLGIWSVQETTGGLFRVDGTLSDDHRFWATRFHVGPPDTGPTFMRIPVGMRTLLEHMAKAVDFLAELSAGDPGDVASEFAQQAYVPELLHYYCLSHWAGPMLERKHGKTEIRKAFLVAGQLVLLISAIPFDDADIWQSLRAYAQARRTDIVPHLRTPHPSFLFPLLLDAAERSGRPLNSYSVSDMKETFETLLHDLGLPALSELEARTRKYASSLFARMETSRLGKEIKKLVEWADAYAQGLDWSERLSDPMKNIQKGLPVPVVFKDYRYWQGSVLPAATIEALAGLAKRQQELLRFPYTRNIVE